MAPVTTFDSVELMCISWCVLRVTRLSLRGRTIIFSIHQPRFAIFKLFDRLSLLAAGSTVYHGNATEALNFFKSIGITVTDDCSFNKVTRYPVLVHAFRSKRQLLRFLWICCTACCATNLEQIEIME